MAVFKSIITYDHLIMLTMSIKLLMSDMSGTNMYGDTIWPMAATEEMGAVSDASSGHLPRCSDADTTQNELEP
jgi:hypothetical protein